MRPCVAVADSFTRGTARRGRPVSEPGGLASVAPPFADSFARGAARRGRPVSEPGGLGGVAPPILVEMPSAVVLLSGGLDSSTLLAVAVRDGFAAHAITFRYGQRHAVEIHAACRVAAHLGAASHRIVDIDLRAFGGSALTADLPVPKDRPLAEMGETIPITYVPARNTIFLSFALALAEVLGAADIFIGVTAIDFSGYPDCRPEYIAAYERMANLATRAAVEGGQRVRIHTPLIALTKAEIIQRGRDLGVDYALTLSCYDPTSAGAACGRCDACQLRLKGFADIGLADPAAYRRI